MLAAKDEDVYKGINALDAYRQDRISENTYLRIMRTTAQRLAAIGIEDLHFRGNHVLLSLDRHGALATGREGAPAVRICNFELLRHIR